MKERMEKLVELGTQYSKLLDEKEVADEKLKNLNKTIKLVLGELLKERDAQGIGDIFEIADVGVLEFKEKISTKLDDRDAYSKWLEDNKLTHMGTYSVHGSKTKALCIQLLKDHKETPAGITINSYTDCEVK